MKTLSIMQPWASLIILGLKDIENRTWQTKVRGDVLIHASKKFDINGYCWLANNWWQVGLPGEVGDFLDRLDISKIEKGGIIGQVQIVDCVADHDSRWKVDGHFGFVLANPKPLPLTPLRGQLGFFEVSID